MIFSVLKTQKMAIPQKCYLDLCPRSKAATAMKPATNGNGWAKIELITLYFLLINNTVKFLEGGMTPPSYAPFAMRMLHQSFISLHKHRCAIEST